MQPTHNTTYTQYNLHTMQPTHNTTYTQYNLHTLQPILNTTYTRYNLHTIQPTHNTTYTQYIFTFSFETVMLNRLHLKEIGRSACVHFKTKH